MALVKVKCEETAHSVAGIITAFVMLAFWLAIAALFESGVWVGENGFNFWSVLK